VIILKTFRLALKLSVS